MTRRTNKTNENLIRGEISIIQEVLKEAGVFLSPEVIKNTERALDPLKYYRIEIIQDEKDAKNRLVLESYEYIGTGATVTDVEEGEAIYGSVLFGREVYSEGEEDEIADDHDVRQQWPDFDPKQIFVVFIERTITTYTSEYRFRLISSIVVYIPTTA